MHGKGRKVTAPEPVTDGELEEIQECIDRASGRPWVLDDPIILGLDGEELVGTVHTREDGEFIVLARQVMGRLVAEIKRLKGYTGEQPR